MAKKDDEQELSLDERLLRIQERQLALQEGQLLVQQQQLKQTAKKSNTQGPKISVFNPRGEKDYPMPRLKCEVYAPWKMSPEIHSLDREEVELFNLLEPGDYTIELTDGSSARVCVVGVRNSNTGALEKLSLLGPKDDTGLHGALFTNENKQTFPPLRSMLRQMIGQPAVQVLSMKKELAQVHAGQLAVSVGAA